MNPFNPKQRGLKGKCRGHTGKVKGNGTLPQICSLYRVFPAEIENLGNFPALKAAFPYPFYDFDCQGVICIQHEEIVTSLVPEYPALGIDIPWEGMVSVHMIRRNVKDSCCHGPELIYGFELKARYLYDHIVRVCAPILFF